MRVLSNVPLRVHQTLSSASIKCQFIPRPWFVLARLPAERTELGDASPSSSVQALCGKSLPPHVECIGLSVSRSGETTADGNNLCIRTRNLYLL